MFESWDHPNRPCCGICGGLIVPGASRFPGNFPGWTEDEQFKRVSVDDFREKLIKEQFHWQSGYRAVVKLGRQPPFISGASYRYSDADIDETGSLPVPKEMESVVLNRNKTWPEDEFIRIEKPHIDSYDTSEANVGWVFHEVCWIMLEQVDDDYQVMNNNLDLFMIAVHDEMTEKREEHTKLIIRAGRNTMWLQRRFKEATVNPFHIPMLGNVTNAALNREVREPKLLMPDIRSAAGFRISGGAFYKLQVETQQMIANHIDDEKDFRAFLLATRWRFPSVYWRKRIPECFYEIHKGIGDQRVDWQWLGLEVSRIVEKQYAEIHNRARIYAHIKRLFVILSQGVR